MNFNRSKLWARLALLGRSLLVIFGILSLLSSLSPLPLKADELVPPRQEWTVDGDLPISGSIPEKIAPWFAEELGVDVDQVALSSSRIPDEIVLQQALAVERSLLALSPDEVRMKEREMAISLCLIRLDERVITSLEDCPIQEAVEIEDAAVAQARFMGESCLSPGGCQWSHDRVEVEPDGTTTICNPSCQVRETGYCSGQVIQIAAGVSTDVPAVVAAFMNSFYHKIAVLYPGIVHIGVGLVYTEGSQYDWYWVINLGLAGACSVTNIPYPPWMLVQPEQLEVWVDPVGNYTQSCFSIQNIGDSPFEWEVANGQELEVDPAIGVINPAETQQVCVQPSKRYFSVVGLTNPITENVVITATTSGAGGSPVQVEVVILPQAQIYRAYIAHLAFNAGFAAGGGPQPQQLLPTSGGVKRPTRPGPGR